MNYYFNEYSTDYENIDSFHNISDILKYNGFIVIRNVIKESDITNAKKIIEDYFLNNGIKITNGKIQPAAAGFIHNLDFIFSNQKIIKIMKKIYGDEKFSFTNHSDVQSNLVSNWHKDSGEAYGGYFDGDFYNDQSCKVYKIGIYLQNCDHKYEGLSVKLGSHMNPSIDFGEEIKLDTKTGDIIIFDVRITHRGKKETKVERFIRIFQKLTKNYFLEKFFFNDKVKRYSIFFTFGINNSQTKNFALRNNFRQNIQNNNKYNKISNQLRNSYIENQIGIID